MNACPKRAFDFYPETTCRHAGVTMAADMTVPADFDRTRGAAQNTAFIHIALFSGGRRCAR